MDIKNKQMLFILLTLVLCIFFSKNVFAQNTTLNSMQSSNVIANCTSIKNRLDQLHVNDALLRVNRGQLYETILSKLMLQFNKRAQSNNLDITSLNSTAEKFSNQLENFRKDYRLYEQQLDETIKTGCSNGAQNFVDSIENARQSRKKVYEDIRLLNTTIDEYSIGFVNIKLSILGK